MYRDGKRNRLGSTEGFKIINYKEGLENLFETPILADLPGDDIPGSCGNYDTVEKLAKACADDDDCLAYTTKDPRCDGRTNVEDCRAGILGPLTVEDGPRKPWCLKSKQRRSRKLTLNNTYSEELTFKSSAGKVCTDNNNDDCFKLPQRPKGWNKDASAEYLNPVFGDLPGYDIRCNQSNGMPWNPDINIAIKQAEVDCANEPDCIGFTTLHKPCLNVANQKNCKEGIYPDYNFNDRRAHCLKSINRPNYNITKRNPWGEMLYIKKGTDAVGKFNYYEDPPKRCPPDTIEVNTGELEDNKLKRGCVRSNGEHFFLDDYLEEEQN